MRVTMLLSVRVSNAHTYRTQSKEKKGFAWTGLTRRVSDWHYNIDKASLQADNHHIRTSMWF